MTPFAAHTETAVGATFSGDGLWLASSSADGSINQWPLSHTTWQARACDVVARNFTSAEWRRYFGDEPIRKTCAQPEILAADELALKGDRAGAERLFVESERLTADAGDAAVNNRLCWFGSLNGFAKLVMPACNRAVELEPLGVFRDSRGVARALAGDLAGAIADFDAIVHNPGFSPPVIRLRTEWLNALKQGRNPFTPQQLTSLRIEAW